MLTLFLELEFSVGQDEFEGVPYVPAINTFSYYSLRLCDRQQSTVDFDNNKCFIYVRGDM
jgi:hypothetical protein